MKIIFTGDWHCGLNSNGRIVDGEHTRSREISSCMQQIFEFARDQGDAAIVQCGDVFHRSRPSTNDLMKVMTFARNCHDNGIPFVVIDGNHDAPAIADVPSPVEIVSFASQSQSAVRRGLRVVFDSPHHQSVELLLTPFPLQFSIWRDHKPAAEHTIVVGHTTLAGAVTGYEQFLLSRVCSVEEPLDYHTICGHIHTPQILRESAEGFVAYTGSLIQNDFGEREQKKGFIVFDTEDASWKFVRLKHDELVQFNLHDFHLLETGAVSGKVVKIKDVVDQQVDTVEIETALYEMGALYVSTELSMRYEVAARDTRMVASVGLNRLFKNYCEIEGVDNRVQSIGDQIIGEVISELS